MAQVTIAINSREYAIACEDGQESRILKLAAMLEEKANLLKSISGQVNENMLLAMIGILIADDLMEAKKIQAPPVQEPSNNGELSKLDSTLSLALKKLNNQIKTIANEIEKI